MSSTGTRRLADIGIGVLVLSSAMLTPALADRDHDNGHGRDDEIHGDDGAASTRSTTIALDGSGSLLFAVNHETNSVTVFRVGEDDGGLRKVDEVPVGREPSCVAVGGDEAFVTNAGSGTVSVIDRSDTRFRVVRTIPVGTEPRGCALTRNGNLLYVTNFTAGTVSMIDTKEQKVVDTIAVGGNPYAIAITDDTVFVTQFFARLRAGGPGEGFDDGKEGLVQAFRTRSPGTIVGIPLPPLADSGFTANRKNLCKQLNANAVNDTFCPNTSITDPTDPRIAADPQGVFPNQLGSAVVCGGRLYLPNIGAQPEPPVFFDTNVQALVHVVDTQALVVLADRTVNLNAQIRTEPTPANPTASLGKLFGNDLVAIATDSDCRNAFIVSRGGNYVLRARLRNDTLDIDAPNGVVRFQTGNIPSGIVVDRNGKRAYVNNEVNLSISILDLEHRTVVARDVPSSTPPEPGSHAHSVLMGKLVFFTALGVPDNGLVGTPVRDVVPLEFRGKQSSNAWSTCGSCHPFGLADGVTWVFPDGPRQSIPLDGLYSKLNPAHDTRINNWSAARDSVTDFNNNSRNVQCGTGFAGGGTNTAIGCPALGSGAPNPNVFDHGISQGASQALDLETTWTQTVRALNMPKPAEPTQLLQGASVFEARCASCHGGGKWTKSQVLYLNNPALSRAFMAGDTPRDPGLTVTANQMVTYADPKVDPNPLKFLEPVGTFNAANPIEIRQNGAAPLGALGLNVPSLLGVGASAPYFHNGGAQTLEDVFTQHALNGGTIANALGSGDQAALLVFLRALDGRTPPFRSEADRFHEPAS